MGITEEELENRLGQITDNAVSARTYTTTRILPPVLCLDALENLLKELTRDLRELYIDATGSDPWADHPKEIQP